MRNWRAWVFSIGAIGLSVITGCRSSDDEGADAGISDAARNDASAVADSGGGVDLGGDADTVRECVPACRSRQCGDDGCGGTCGECASPLTCREDGMCVEVEAGCMPRCFGRSCGDDGCGGTCGTCVESACDNIALPPGVVGAPRYMCVPSTYPTSDVCPPSRDDEGTAVGSVVPDFPLTRCDDGTSINVRGLCTNELTLVVRVNIDCITCIQFVNTTIKEVQEAFGPELKVYIVLGSDSECADHDYFVRDDLTFLREYAFQFSMLHIWGTSGNDQVLAMQSGNRLVLYKNRPSFDEIRDALLSTP